MAEPDPAQRAVRIRVWLDPEAGPAPPEGALPAAEEARAERFRRPEDRALYRASHAMLRAVLADAAGVEPGALDFAAGPQGKPHVAAPGPARGLVFNLTHTRGAAGVALAPGGAVGLDLETGGPRRDGLAERLSGILAPAEADWLRARPGGVARRDGFLTLWTLKEAYMKATGLGLRLDTKRFALLPDGERARLVDPGPPDLVGAGEGHWHFLHRILRPGLHLGCALRCASARRPVFEILPYSPGVACC